MRGLWAGSLLAAWQFSRKRANMDYYLVFHSCALIIDFSCVGIIMVRWSLRSCRYQRFVTIMLIELFLISLDGKHQWLLSDVFMWFETEVVIVCACQRLWSWVWVCAHVTEGTHLRFMLSSILICTVAANGGLRFQAIWMEASVLI